MSDEELTRGMSAAGAAVVVAQRTILRRLGDCKLGEVPDVDGDLLRASGVACLDAEPCRDGRRMACCRTCARAKA